MEGLVTVEPIGKTSNRTEGAVTRILLTGSEGYIGSVLGHRLVTGGYQVVGADTGYYRAGWLYNDGKDRPALLSRDVRTLTVADLEGFDAVVHLAELSNDPLCAQDPELTFAINHKASAALARNAKAAGVKRFVYASSCSVYGAGAGDDAVDEGTPTNPQTPYAKCKVLVEEEVSKLADASFCPIFLRNATAFGASPAMRFDIVLNNLAGLAWTTRRIAMISDGSPWRPLVHVQDICAAIICTLRAPRGGGAGEVFNVGSDDQNYRIREIAEAVGEASLAARSPSAAMTATTAATAWRSPRSPRVCPASNARGMCAEAPPSCTRFSSTSALPKRASRRRRTPACRSSSI